MTFIEFKELLLKNGWKSIRSSDRYRWIPPESKVGFSLDEIAGRFVLNDVELPLGFLTYDELTGWCSSHYETAGYEEFISFQIKNSHLAPMGIAMFSKMKQFLLESLTQSALGLKASGSESINGISMNDLIVTSKTLNKMGLIELPNVKFAENFKDEETQKALANKAKSTKKKSALKDEYQYRKAENLEVGNVCLISGVEKKIVSIKNDVERVPIFIQYYLFTFEDGSTKSYYKRTTVVIRKDSK